jgi:uncharacterized protein YwgA
MAKDAYDGQTELVHLALIDGVLNAAREGVADIVKEYSDEKTKIAKIAKVRDAANRFIDLIDQMVENDGVEDTDASASDEHNPTKS